MGSHSIRPGSRLALLLALLFLAFALLVPNAALAQDYDRAGKHFAAGQERFAAKRFHTAALHFQAAYDITKDPVLLFNVGEAWQNAGEGNKASASYNAYLLQRPDAPDRGDVEKRAALIGKSPPGDQSVATDKPEAEAIIASGAPPGLPNTDPASPADRGITPTTSTPTTLTDPPAPKPADPPGMQVGLLDDRPAGKLRIAAWCTVASTIALLTTGAILGLAAQSRSDEVNRRLAFVNTSGQPSTFDASAQSDFKNLQNEGKLYNGLAIGFYTAAAAMAVTTTVLFVVDWKKHSAQKDGERKLGASADKARAFLRDLRAAPQVVLGRGTGSSPGFVMGGRF